ncbi:uncharacterized protein LOC131995808 [Stomoxys calcitrans]|uniref:uncharacterized protein LOC131995808 n=1 Tax=Stomoxys calcitrans TaxID=35570 RepID=UPI0027E29313|nr:uncharacterized protein LOC131995808 [Stomoxys calcitrans]
MVLTRQGSRQQSEMENDVPVSTSGADTRPMAENTAVTASTAIHSSAALTTTTTSSIAPHVSSDVSFNSDVLNNTVISPAFASRTAQGIRRDFRRENMEFQMEPGYGDGIHEMIASVGVAQAQLMRSVEEIMQLGSALNQRMDSVRHSIPPIAALQPPPSMPRPDVHVRAEHQGMPPPPRFDQARESGQWPGFRNPPPLTGPGTANRPAPNNNAYIHERFNRDVTQPPEAFYWQSSQNTPYSYIPSPGPRMDLQKWGIKFDGSGKTMDAEDFVFRVESMRQDYVYPFEALVKNFPQLLDGTALDWYWQQRRIAPFQSWDDLKNAFLCQFRRFESEFQIQKRIMDRRQQPQESFEDFFNAVVKLRNQQRFPYSERDLVEIMKGNLKSALAALIFPIKLRGLNHFRQEVKRAESMLANQRQAYQQRSFQAPRVHELYYEEANMETVHEAVNLEVDALKDTTKYTCWNCRKSGHSYIECPVPMGRVFCFRCGKEGVVTPKCPKCQGNLTRSAPRTAEARSTQTEIPQQ